MIQTVSYVFANFGGKPVRFELPREAERLDALEKEIGSIAATWERFRGGAWTIADVRSVLRAAHPPQPIEHVDQSATPHAAILKKDMRLGGSRLVSPGEIDAVLRRRPLATYAPLAAAIITAAFIGLPAKDAHFDEDATITAAPAEEEAAA